MLWQQLLSFFHQEAAKSPWPERGQVTGGVGGCVTRPLLTRAAATGGDRSKELLTGGAPDTPQQLPLRDAASAHLTGSGNRKSGKLREVLFPSSTVTLLLYFVTPPCQRQSEAWNIDVTRCVSYCILLWGCKWFLVVSLRKTHGEVLFPCKALCLISHTKGKSCLFITEGLLTVRARYYSIPRHILISAIALHSVCHPVSLPPLHPSSSQVGIHHHVGGQLTSDSFVNVNYCSLSEPRESGTCRPVRRRLRRSQNNQPMCLDSLSRPLAHANMQI